MEENIIKCQCEKCKFEWEEKISVPMHIKSFLKRLDLLCPQCAANSKHIVIKTDQESEEVNGKE